MALSNKLLLALPQRTVAAQPAQLRGRAAGEDAEHGQRLRILGHRPVVHHGEVPEHAAVRVEQGNAEVAHGPERLQVRVGGVQLHHAVRHVHEAPVVHHGLARRPVDAVLVVAVEAVRYPEGERAQPPLGLQPLGDPHALRAERAGEVANQLVEERLAGLRDHTGRDLAEDALVHRSPYVPSAASGRRSSPR
jgi:hypothetical protein